MKQLKERVFVACGVPVSRQKIFGLPAAETVALSRLNLVDGQQLLLFRTKETEFHTSSLQTPTIRGEPSADGESFWDWVPSEVQYLIFGLLDPSSLLSCASVSSNWNELAKDNWLWQEYFTQRWSTQKEITPPEGVSWRSLYFEHLWLQKNWAVGNFKVTRFGQTQSSALDHRQNGFLAMCSDQDVSSSPYVGAASSSSGTYGYSSFSHSGSNQARPWRAGNSNAFGSPSEFDLIQAKYTFDKMDSLTAIATPHKHTVSVGNIWRNEVKKELLGHTAYIQSVAFAGLHHLISADQSGQIFLWDLHRSRALLPWSTTSSEFVGKRQICRASIGVLHCAGSFIVAGTADGTMVCLDTERTTYPALVMRGAHAEKVLSIDSRLATSHLIASSGDDGFAKVWDNRTGQATLKLYADTDTVEQVLLGWDNQILTCGSNGVRVWDMRSSNLLMTPFEEATTSIAYNGSSILMAGASKLCVAEMGVLGLPPSEITLDPKPSPFPVNSQAPPEYLRTFRLPVPSAKRLFATSSSLVCTSSGTEVIGLDLSAKPIRVYKADRPIDDDDDDLIEGQMDVADE
jgi:hypothetical protein